MKHLLLILPLLLLACKGEEATTPAAVGMANPASVYCAEQGGTAMAETTPTGQISICTLPGGERIEEWALYRRDHPTDEQNEATPVVEQPVIEQPVETPAAQDPAIEQPVEQPAAE